MATSLVDQAYEMYREQLFGQLMAVTRDAALAGLAGASAQLAVETSSRTGAGR
jgi:hypothetical protein